MSDTTEVLATDHPLSVNARRNLQVLVEVMIPASAEYRVPGANDPLIFADILESARPSHELVAQAMAMLDGMSGKHGSDCFADLEGADAQVVADEFRQTPLAGLVVMLTTQCYYRDDRVMQALDMEPRAPFPGGHEVPAGDWSLLEPVRQKGPLYRDAP